MNITPYTNQQFTIRPIFKRVRVVIYKNDSYKCSCNYFKDIVIYCRHIFAIGVPISLSCFHVRYWNMCNFYYQRESTSNEMNATFDNLCKMKNIASDQIEMGSQFPYSRDNITSIEEITSVHHSLYPIVLNWSQQDATSSIQMCPEGIFLGVGFSQESNIDDAISPFDIQVIQEH